MNIRQVIRKILKEEMGKITTKDPKKAEELAKKGVDVELNEKKGKDLDGDVDCQIPSYFLNKLFEIDAIMFQQTIDATLSVINLKNNDDINGHLDKLKRKSIQKSMFWCIHNHFDYDHCVTDSIIGR